jgi:hypothetical protein
MSLVTIEFIIIFFYICTALMMQVSFDRSLTAQMPIISSLFISIAFCCAITASIACQAATIYSLMILPIIDLAAITYTLLYVADTAYDGGFAEIPHSHQLVCRINFGHADAQLASPRLQIISSIEGTSIPKNFIIVAQR